jgi:hypothetical protein
LGTSDWRTNRRMTLHQPERSAIAADIVACLT